MFAIAHRSLPPVNFQCCTKKGPLEFKSDSSGNRVVSIGKKTYQKISDLLAEHPNLIQDESARSTAAAINFLYTGWEYKVIDEPGACKQSGLSSSPRQSLCPTAFDLSGISKPVIEHGFFKFFVKDQDNIPYQVSYPLTTNEEGVVYQKLPYKN